MTRRGNPTGAQFDGAFGEAFKKIDRLLSFFVALATHDNDLVRPGSTLENGSHTCCEPVRTTIGRHDNGYVFCAAILGQGRPPRFFGYALGQSSAQCIEKAEQRSRGNGIKQACVPALTLNE